MREVTVRRQVTDGQGNRTLIERRLTVRDRTRFGMSALPGQPWTETLAGFPSIRYVRDFGKDRDGDKRPELPDHGAGKMAAPPNVLVHVSWKDDVEQLKPWLDDLTRRIYLTWWHEPMGDMTPSAYRSTCARMVQILNAHPNRRLVLHHGPIVTRWWLDQGGGNPADWWYDGATMYGVDCYNDSGTRYRTASEMFGSAVKVARDRGVPWLVPEYGIERIVGDGRPGDPTVGTGGAGRAKVLRDHAKWIRNQPDCLAVGWWNTGGDVISGLEPEQTAWREVLANQ